MKKTLTIVSLLAMLVLCLTSCRGHTESISLHICGAYAVPGMYHSDVKGGNYITEVVEKDTEGRILFKFSGVNAITRKEETAMIICQKIDSDYVYFYEDLCYLRNEYSEAGVESLKATNDWNMPLDISKSSRRENRITFDLFIVRKTSLQYDRLKDSVCVSLGIEASKVQELYIIDANVFKQSLFFLKCEIGEEIQEHIVFVSEHYDVEFLNIANGQIDPAAIAEFKQANGWIYG